MTPPPRAVLTAKSLVQAVRTAKSLVAAGALVAAGVLAQPSAPIIDAQVDPTSCLLGSNRIIPYEPTDAEWESDDNGDFVEAYIEEEPYPTADEQAAFTLSSSVTIALRCGGVGGPVGGPGVGMAKAGGNIPVQPYGRPGSGKVVDTQLSNSSMKSFVQSQGVPWPCATCKLAANTDTYRVYTIWAKGKTGSKTFKYGITKVGASRPEGQLAKCAQLMKVSECGWKWVRTDVGGWRAARKWEAHHAARYKSKFGHCPPGMSKCY